MDKHDIIVAQLNRNSERLDMYNAHLERLTVTVEEHVRRTNLLEQELKPIKQHVQFINMLAKFAVGAAGFILVLKNIGMFG